jgi:hypothetical protein
MSLTYNKPFLAVTYDERQVKDSTKCRVAFSLFSRQVSVDKCYTPVLGGLTHGTLDRGRGGSRGNN